MIVYIGIDGGGSTCRARAVDAQGAVLGEGQAGPSNISTDLDGSLSAILSAAQAALAGHPAARVRAALGLAGANNVAAAKALEARLPFAVSRVVTDGHISTAGALGPDDGIVAAIGTGSVFVLQKAGQQREIGGKGLILGDESSGAWLGRALLASTLRAVDGFQPRTALLDQTLRSFGGVEAIIAFAATARPSDFATLAPQVTQAEDPAAQAILAQAKADCLASVAILQGTADLPVVCLGGLAPVYAPEIARHWTVRAPLGTALDGAVALARALTRP